MKSFKIKLIKVNMQNQNKTLYPTDSPTTAEHNNFHSFIYIEKFTKRTKSNKK